MNLRRRRFLHLAGGATTLPAMGRVACAETYPARPIRLVVPFPPGGAFDTLARPWVEQVKPVLGTLVVENIGGGGSSLGAATVARARPDGYTILLGGSLPHVNEAQLKSRPLYDPVKDLDPIAGLAVVALALAVHPSVPAQNLKEFVAYAKALRTRRCWLAEPADWGNVQIARGVARAHADTLSRRGAGDGGPDQRASRHGRGGSNQPVARISPVRKAAGSRRDEPPPSHRRTRASDRGGGGLSGPDQSIDDRAGRSCRNAGADRRADCARGTRGARGTGLPAEVDRFRLRSRQRPRNSGVASKPMLLSGRRW